MHTINAFERVTLRRLYNRVGALGVNSTFNRKCSNSSFAYFFFVLKCGLFFYDLQLLVVQYNVTVWLIHEYTSPVENGLGGGV